MSDRAHPVAMNESDLWLGFFRGRAAGESVDVFPLQGMDIFSHGQAALADADLAEFRKRYPHRVHDDRPEVAK